MFIRTILISLLVAVNAFGAGLQASFTGANLEGLTRSTTVFEFRGDAVDPVTGNLLDISGSNYFLQSEDFSTTWGAAGATVSTNTTRNPITHELTADTLVEGAAGTYHYVGQSFTTTVGKTYTVSVYVRKANRDWFSIEVDYAATGDARCYYNLATGSVGATPLNAVCRLDRVADGWYRAILTFPGQGASALFALLAAEADNDYRYTGLSQDSTVLYGAQLSVNDYPNIPQRRGAGLYHKTVATAKAPIDMTASASAPTPGHSSMAGNKGERLRTRAFNAASSQRYSLLSIPLIQALALPNHTVTIVASNTNETKQDFFGDYTAGNGADYRIGNGATYTYTKISSSCTMTWPATTTGAPTVWQSRVSNALVTPYANGTQGTSVDCSANLPVNGGTARIGDTNRGNYFTGNFSYMRLDAEALSPAQLTKDREILQGTWKGLIGENKRKGHLFSNPTGVGAIDNWFCTLAACPFAAITGDFSIACVITPYNIATNLGLIGRLTSPTSWEIAKIGSNLLFSTSIDGAATTNNSVAAGLTVGKPTFFTHTYDYVGAANSVSTFYVDALATDTSNTLSGPPFNSAADFTIARSATRGTFPGEIPYCAIFDGTIVSEAQHDAMYANFLNTGDPNHESQGLVPTFLARLNQDPSGATITTQSGHVLTKTGQPQLVDATLNPVQPWTFTRSTTAYMKLPGGGANANKPSLVKVAAGVPRVSDGVLIEPQVTNLHTYSEELNRLTLSDALTSAMGTDAAVAVDGTTTAESWTAIADAGDPQERYAYNGSAIAIANTTAYTYSLFARRGTSLRWIGLDFNTNFAGRDPVSFDLLTGTVGTQGAGSVGRIEPYGDDWYRISITATSTAAASSTDVIRIYMQDGDNDRSLTGTGNVEYYLWGASLYAWGYPMQYVQTTTASASKNADLMYVPMYGTNSDSIFPKTISAALGSKFTASFDMKCSHTLTTQSSGSHMLVQFTGNTGTASSTQNWVRLYLDRGNQKTYFRFQDDAGTTVDNTGVDMTTVDQWHTYKFFSDMGNQTRAYTSIDGVRVATPNFAPGLFDITNMNVTIGTGTALTSSSQQGSCFFKNVRVAPYEF